MCDGGISNYGELMSFNYLSKHPQDDWSRSEEIKLLKLAGTMSIKNLVKEFPNRNIGAVKAKCARHGIKYGFNGE